MPAVWSERPIDAGRPVATDSDPGLRRRSSDVKDNSADEMNFMVMRMMHDGLEAGQMELVAELVANAVEFHDASIESGMTYMYRVSAMNETSESKSNEVLLAAP